jgi:hypothetical protein
MLTRIYYDYFDNSYVTEKDPYAPPERYLETKRGPSGKYTEIWLVNIEDDDGMPIKLDDIIQVDFDAEDYYDHNYHSGCLSMAFAVHSDKNIMPVRMKTFILPEEKFDEYAKRFGIYEET